METSYWEKEKEKSQRRPQRGRRSLEGGPEVNSRFNLWGGSKPEKKQQPESPRLGANGGRLGASGKTVKECIRQ